MKFSKRLQELALILILPFARISSRGQEIQFKSVSQGEYNVVPNPRISQKHSTFNPKSSLF
jgi:hypothetical protein